ncbi:MAG: zf-HC2 domain-containing protein [Pseudomonadales bacterium]|nr:zf-HC2 domain-containing protein [Pseudomonadales bacterium]
MLTCREINECGTDYIDKQLSLRKRLAVRMHLFLCNKCRSFMRQFRLSVSYFQAMPADENISDKEASEIADKIFKSAHTHND